MDKSQKLYAVLGDPISHSLSPKIHQFWMDEYQMNTDYVALPVAAKNFPEILTFLPKMGFHGINLTIPHKEIALPLCDELSDAAKEIGAVNTILFQNGKIFGDNTDAQGFITALKKEGNCKNFTNKKAVIIGAGGASRAVIYGLLQEKVSHIAIVNRTLERAQKLCNFYQKNYDQVIFEALSVIEDVSCDCDFIINSSSCGMNGDHDIVIDFHRFSAPIIYDLVYKPRVTKFLHDAKLAQFTAINGLGMLLYQAAYAFEIWFGVLPNVGQKLRDSIHELTG